MTKNETCETCRWWREWPALDEDEYCHRHAPSPTTVEDTDMSLFALWPITGPNDGCGEHEPSER